VAIIYENVPGPESLKGFPDNLHMLHKYTFTTFTVTCFPALIGCMDFSPLYGENKAMTYSSASVPKYLCLYCLMPFPFCLKEESVM
jgi:hypothetical protein